MSNSIDENKSLASPCIRNCCLNTKDICLGCFRHIDEILVWGKASFNEKEVILQRVASRKILKSDV